MADHVKIPANPAEKYILITVSTTAIGIPEASLVTRTGAPIDRVVGRVETASVRLGIHGIITPAATVGVLLKADDIIEIEGYENIKNARFIEVSGGATIRLIGHVERKY